MCVLSSSRTEIKINMSTEGKQSLSVLSVSIGWVKVGDTEVSVLPRQPCMSAGCHGDTSKTA